MEMSHGFFIVSIVACGISLLNYARYDELRRKYEFHYDHMSRHRRDASSGDVKNEKVPNTRTNGTFPLLPAHERSLFMNIDELKGFIKEELRQIIDPVMQPALENKLSNWLQEMKCNCLGGSVGPRGPKGERGERGPRGERGERGPSLHPPELKQRNITVTANVSDSRVFSCLFLGNPLPKVSWKSPATIQKVTQFIDRENSLVRSELKVTNITWADRGNITCHASNILGNDEGSGHLTVHAKPIIVLPDGPVVGTLGSVADFPECKVVSEPSASVSWSRGFLHFPKGRTSRKDGVLKISNSQVKDEGYYVCTAKNYLGTAKKYLQLRVKRLQFSAKSPYRIYRSNGEVTLTCAAYGSVKRLSGRWTKVLTLGVDEVLNNTSEYKSSELVLATEARTSGKYKCEINDGVNTIKTISEVKIFKLHSSLMQTSEVNQLGQWLSMDLSGEYKLCWRMSEHGNSTDVFFKQCSNRTNTISIFKNKTGELWGGFTDAPWKESERKLERSKASWTTSCGGNVNNLGIDYPQHGNYPNNRQCTWTISRNAPFTLRFLRLATEGSYDYVKIGNKKFSGMKIPGEINSIGNSLTVQFRSDGGTQKRGFKVEIVSDEYISSARTFMFSNDDGRLKQIQIKNPEKAVCRRYNFGPCFGERSLVYLQPGTLSLGYASSQPSTVQLEDVEVFYQVKN